MIENQRNISSVPEISVLMPVYNVGRYVGEAVESILNQSFTDFELIAIDDGSTDQSLGILKEYQQRDPRITIISRPNTGISKAINDGLDVAQGELVAIMDGDDIALPRRLEIEYDYLANHPECVLVGTRFEIMDPMGNPMSEPSFPLSHKEIEETVINQSGSASAHATWLMRRSAVEAVGGYREGYDVAEDMEILLRLAEVGQIANLPDVLYRYRQHLKSVTKAAFDVHLRSVRKLLRDMEKRRGITLDWQMIEANLADNPGPTPASALQNWALHAIRRGNAGAARRHAFAALWREPFSLNAWKVMYWAMSV